MPYKDQAKRSECARESARRLYYVNKKAIAAKRLQQRHADPVHTMWTRSKARAKAKGMPFNLDHADIVIPAKCPVLGIPLFVSRRFETRDNSPSLDRIDSTKGYVKGNVRVISHRANRFKADGTPHELQAVAADAARMSNWWEQLTEDNPHDAAKLQAQKWVEYEDAKFGK